MRLHASSEIVEAAEKGDMSGGQTAGEVVDFVGHGVPLAVNCFFGVGVGGRFAGVALFDERVEVDHFGVAVEGLEDCCTGYAFGQGGQSGEGGSFEHGGQGSGKVLNRWISEDSGEI